MDIINTMFTDYISVLTMVICVCVGYVVKHFVPGDMINRFIPLIAAVLGVAISVWSAMAFTPQVLAVGLVSGLASTGLYEMVDQFILAKYMRGVKNHALDPSDMLEEETEAEEV